MRIDDVTAHTMRSSAPPLFQQYLMDGLQRGSYILLHRSGNEIPITYIARAYPRRMPRSALGSRMRWGADAGELMAFRHRRNYPKNSAFEVDY
jgi:hypothetical protein